MARLGLHLTNGMKSDRLKPAAYACRYVPPIEIFLEIKVYGKNHQGMNICFINVLVVLWNESFCVDLGLFFFR